MSIDGLKEPTRPWMSLGLSAAETTLRTRIKLYIKRAQEVEQYLAKYPDRWGKFQQEFNSEMDGIFRDIMNYEKANLAKGNIDRVQKLKKLFIKRIRKLLLRKQYFEWSMKRPFGYNGDYKIIDDIYLNNPQTVGFNRLFDNYFQTCPISISVRNRKEDFKKIIRDFINKRQKKQMRVMSLACGPCRDILEMLSSKTFSDKSVNFDCYDADERALKYAKDLLHEFSNVNFYQENVVRLAATKNVTSRIKKRYDVIYSTGLFDYLNAKISTRLMQNLRMLLKDKGILIISNVRDKYSNPNAHYMEWTGDWELVYRDDNEFKSLFIDAGFKPGDLTIQYEQQGIMQYIIATNERDPDTNGLLHEFQ